MPPARTWLRWAAINIIEVVAILVVAELLWRVLVPESVPGNPELERARTALNYLRPCVTVANRAGEPVLAGTQAEYTGGEFVYPVAKSPGTVRIAFVGESTGAMLATALYELSADDRHGGKIEVLNCASAGSALEHVERRAHEALQYSPDAVVVVFGHNLMMRYPMGERMLRFQSYLYRSRLAAGIASGVIDAEPWRLPERDERLAIFGTWLRRFARETRERGIPLVLTTMTANLWYPPGVTVDDTSEPRFLVATFDQASGRLDGAIKTLSSLVAQQPRAYWQFILGTWLARSGQTEGAALHLRAAVDGDAVEPDRAPAAVNALIRQIAHDEGLLLRDTEAQMSALSRNGLPSWDVMRDHCHLLPVYLWSEAAAIFDLVHSATGRDGSRQIPAYLATRESDTISWILNGLTSTQAARDDAWAYRHQRAIAFFVEHSARTQPERTVAAVEAFVSGPTFVAIEVPERRAAILASIADGYWWAGLSELALAMNERARREAVEQPWVQLGLFRVESGNPAGATDAFRKARDLAPAGRTAEYFLARLAEG